MTKKILRIIGFIIGIPVAFIILVVIIGWIVDLVTLPSIKSEGKIALQELNALTKKGEDNAWNYYAQAMEKMKDTEIPDDLDKYLLGQKNLTDEMMISFSRSNDVIALMQEGADKPYCFIPYEYEKGVEAELPDFLSLRECAKVCAGQALSAFEIGILGHGLSNTLNGLTTGKHIISGAPLLINYMVGIVTSGIYLKILEPSVASGSFNVQQLDEIHGFLDEYERTMPSLVWALDGERKTFCVTLANTPLEVVFFQQIYTIKGSFIHGLVLRFWVWQYWFSPHLATLKALESWDDILSEMNASAKGLEYTVEYDVFVARQFKEKGVVEHIRNPILRLFVPNYHNMFARKSKTLARIRLANCAALVWRYKIENGTFPASLDLINSNATKDPFRDETWGYVVTKNSAILTSPGYNLTFGDDDDLSTTLKKSSIREYLSIDK